MRLSVIDLGPPAEVAALVPELDQLGFRRYWSTEHYSPTPSASPAVLAAAAAQATSGGRIRIGTTGVLLNFRSPASVLADFAVLEAIAPGRIDLGVAASTAGGAQLADALLDGRARPTRRSYDAKVGTLVDVLSGNAPSPPLEEIGPRSATRPEVWVCGTSTHSARLAGSLGCRYAFHHELRDPHTDGASVVRTYRERFLAAGHPGEPEAVLAVYTVCGRSDAAASRAAVAGAASHVGSAARVADGLARLAAHHEVGEVVTYAFAGTAIERHRSYELLAEAVREMSPV